MGYIAPVDARISDTWAGHLARPTPSAEPGTDYACAKGTPIRAAAAGRVVARQTSPAGATGRFITIDLDDGRRVRYLHLASVSLPVGARVTAGQHVAVSGASGHGREDGFGAHVHVTLWPNHAYVFNNARRRDFTGSLDFEKYLATGAPAESTTEPALEEETDMPIHLKRERTGDTYTVVPGRYIKHHPDKKNGDIAGYLTTGNATARSDFRGLSDADFAIAMWDLGFPELRGDLNKLPKNGGYYWSPGPTGKGNYS